MLNPSAPLFVILSVPLLTTCPPSLTFKLVPSFRNVILPLTCVTSPVSPTFNCPALFVILTVPVPLLPALFLTSPLILIPFEPRFVIEIKPFSPELFTIIAPSPTVIPLPAVITISPFEPAN